MANFEIWEVDGCGQLLGLASSAARSTGTSANAAPAAGRSSRKSRAGAGWDQLNRGEKMALRMLQAGNVGVITSELFAGMYVAKYTCATSEMRLKQGHGYECRKVGRFPGQIETEQWRYWYAGFRGDRAALHPQLAAALERWESLTARLAGSKPWEERQ
jgi:hypothetical protein